MEEEGARKGNRCDRKIKGTRGATGYWKSEDAGVGTEIKRVKSDKRKYGNEKKQ